MGKTFLRTRNTNKRLDIIIPRSYILISYRPIRSKAIFRISFKIQFTSTITLPAPYYATTSYLISPRPFKWLYLDIWIVQIIHKVLLRSLIVIVNSTLDRTQASVFLGNSTSERQFPGMEHIIVVCDMLHISTTLKNQSFQTFLTQFFSSPSAAYPCADNNSIIYVIIHFTASNFQHLKYNT